MPGLIVTITALLLVVCAAFHTSDNGKTQPENESKRAFWELSGNRR